MKDANPLGLSREQLAALNPTVRLVEAGPGAGKTRTVVARLMRDFDEGRRVAMLSFTNAAVDVARHRCRDAPLLLEPPNFVGTFDSFFRRYVVTPAIMRLTGQRPRYLTSWDDLRSSMALVRPPSGGAAIRLTSFAESDGVWAVDEGKLNRQERLSWEKLTSWSKQKLNESGNSRISSLLDAHIYDTIAARQRALTILDSVESPLPLLARRFSEVIIDEFQDCDAIEHAIVDRLTDAGIHVVAVADPDQAIYEFRQTNSTLYEQFRDGVPVGDRANLTTCYRSTPVICSLINSLRAVGLGDVRPSPDHSGGSSTVHVVVGSGVRAGEAAYKIIRQAGISLNKTRVIAHRRSDARALLRSGQEPPHGISQMETLLVALADLRSRADPAGRLRAVRRVEAFVLNHFDWPDDRPTEGRSDQLELLGLSSEELRGIAGQLLKSSHDWHDTDSCKSHVRRIIEDLAGRTDVALMPRVGTRLQISPKVWSFWESRTAGLLSETPDALRWGHVHGVKGDEFEAVIMALPSASSATTHVLDDWRDGNNSEQRRVLYVGVSRAMKELVLVVPQSRRDQLVSILAAGGIQHSVTVA
ncbi:ATP-dependent helicase [Mycobacterium malmoense]|uniref:ATP-dependent helicase n=1 Tax=Mycobacterium malmoense TaxID=1780 RepID=UPI0009F68BCB|nr:ATP-dependent helicase [Mycobacterium malmoense]